MSNAHPNTCVHQVPFTPARIRFPKRSTELLGVGCRHQDLGQLDRNLPKAFGAIPQQEWPKHPRRVSPLLHIKRQKYLLPDFKGMPGQGGISNSDKVKRPYSTVRLTNKPSHYADIRSWPHLLQGFRCDLHTGLRLLRAELEHKTSTLKLRLVPLSLIKVLLKCNANDCEKRTNTSNSLQLSSFGCATGHLHQQEPKQGNPKHGHKGHKPKKIGLYLYPTLSLHIKTFTTSIAMLSIACGVGR